MKREEEKRIQRIYSNWKRVINGALLKERMKEKYGTVVDKSNNDTSEINKCGEKRRKITAEDITAAIPNNLITHSVPNLKIDFNSTVVERDKKNKCKMTRFSNKKVTEKSKIPIPAKNASNTGKNLPVEIHKNLHANNSVVDRSENTLSSSEESDSDFMTEKKRESIRTLLKWNPSTFAASESRLNLSDDSDIDDYKIEENRSNQSCPSSIKRSKTKKKSSVLTKKNKKASSSLGNEMDKNGEVCVQNRRLSLRRSNRVVNSYKEEPNSDKDISFSDSDVDDKPYDPRKEVGKNQEISLDLSEDSD